MKLQLAVTAGMLLFAGIAGAATSHPARDSAIEPSPSASGPHLDFTSCGFRDARSVAQEQIDAALRLPASERGRAIANGPCVVGSNAPVPTRVDERDRR